MTDSSVDIIYSQASQSSNPMEVSLPSGMTSPIFAEVRELRTFLKKRPDNVAQLVDSVVQ